MFSAEELKIQSYVWMEPSDRKPHVQHLLYLLLPTNVVQVTKEIVKLKNPKNNPKSITPALPFKQ